jgi:hypothetical protein
MERRASNIRDWYPSYGWGHSSDIVRVWALMQTAPFSLQQAEAETGASGYVVDRLVKRGEFVRIDADRDRNVWEGPRRRRARLDVWVIGADFFEVSEVKAWAAILGVTGADAAARQREAEGRDGIEIDVSGKECPF